MATPPSASTPLGFSGTHAPRKLAASFIIPATRNVPDTAADDDDLLDELNGMDHPILDALERERVSQVHRKIKTPWKRTLYKLFESPTSSSSAFIVHAITTGLIVISAFITVLETLPIFHSTPSHIWFGLETSLVVLFTIEYVGRLLAHSESWSILFNWATSFFAVVDLIAILPYYVMIAIRTDTTAFFRFSILRTFRLLRVFRPFRYSSNVLLTIEVMYMAVKRSKEALLALAFFVGMALVVFSTLLYFAERGTWDEALETFVNSDGDPSQFESIPAAAWFVLVTMTTVGYGEIIPRSFLGRLITLPLLMFGLLLIALPSFVLGREFSTVWDGMGGTKMLRLAAQRQPPTTLETDPRVQTDPENEPSEERGLVFSADSPEEGTHAYPPPVNRPPRRAVNPVSPFPLSTPDLFGISPTRRRRRASESGSSGISNLKLAENQQVLSGQLEDVLRSVAMLTEEVKRLRKGTTA